MGLRWVLSAVLLAAIAAAHPMGNFSVNHYARIEVAARGAGVDYVLDLAEIPSFELLQKWGLDASAAPAELQRKAADEARSWADHLAFTVNGRAVHPRFVKATLAMDKGAGGMPVMRVRSRLSLDAAAGALAYEDHNYAGRAGWKEIVVAAGTNAAIEKSSAGGQDRSSALTAYPQDPLIAPPQDKSATVQWRLADAVKTESKAPAPVAAAPVATSPVAPQSSAPGTVVRGDFLSQLMHRGEISTGMILVGLVVAFGLGAMHALSPGHGKTIVAAYLVGNRGTFKHAIFLGAMVTFTHTFSVFCLGLTTLYLYRDVLPDNVMKWLGAISGMSIVWIGAVLLFKRSRILRRGHVHPHGHDHPHDHDHDHVHGPGGHTHVPEGEITLTSLIALGVSGGLVPCPSALVLLLSSIALGRVGLGLTLLVGFSLGLAVVLMGIGMIVLYAKNLIPDQKSAAGHAAFRVIPVLSAAVIVCLGLLMTGVSLGWIRPSRFIG